MTCDEVRELILFVPLNEHGAHTHVIIEAHTESCERCRSLWREELLLSQRLHELPDIRAASNTVSSVLSRVTAIDEHRACVAARGARLAETNATWRPWTASVGLAAMLAIYLHIAIGGQTGLELGSPIVGFGQENILTGNFSAPTAIGFVVALFAYIAGLFASDRADD